MISTLRQQGIDRLLEDSSGNGAAAIAAYAAAGGISSGVELAAGGRGAMGLTATTGGATGAGTAGPPFFPVALMLEVADSAGRGGVLRLRRHGQRLDGRGAVIHVFVRRDLRDAQGAPHQQQTNQSNSRR